MSETIERTITWHPAETAPKDEKPFTIILEPLGKLSENWWQNATNSFHWKDFTRWTRDKVTP